MGCEFKLTIQVLHGAHWVSILILEIRTSCGGYPLTDAVWQMVQKHGVRGTYGTNYPIIKASTLLKPCLCAKPESPPSLKKESDIPGTELKSEENKKSADDAISDDDDEPNYLYYSTEQFDKLIQCTGPTLSSYNVPIDDSHKDGLAKIPPWFEICKSTLPIEESYYNWWFEDSSFVDKLLLESRDKLRKQYTALLQKELRSTSLDYTTIGRIAEFSLPTASDVRVQWYDGENRTEAVSKGKPVPPGTGYPPPECCIQ